MTPARVDSPRWLSPAEQRDWRAFLEATVVLFNALDRQMQQDSDIPHTYYEILVRLSESPQRALRMSELAEASQSSRSRLSHAVARLEERGWVRREECPTDKRGQIAHLTDAGYSALTEAAPAHVEAVRRYLLDKLTADQFAALGEISRAIIAD